MDDELTSRKALAAIVAQLGHAVVVAHDGRAAWEQHCRSPFPVVLTDWMMPEMSGLELTQRVRSAALEGTTKPAEGYTFVLVVTALSERERALEAFEAGVDELVTKPIDAERIRAGVGVAARIAGGLASAKEAGIRRSVGDLQAAVGANDPRLLESLDALVALYRSQDAHAKARAFLRREVAIVRHAFGPHHPRLKSLLAQLGELTALGSANPS
ncbi:MAG: response regulator [Myxococcales bacterium]|nr:response regulator [Myxococcales bacterium]